MNVEDEYRTQDGGRILVSPERREHLAAHPEIGAVLEEAISLIALPANHSALWEEAEGAE